MDMMKTYEEHFIEAYQNRGKTTDVQKFRHKSKGGVDQLRQGGSVGFGQHPKSLEPLTVQAQKFLVDNTQLPEKTTNFPQTHY